MIKFYRTIRKNLLSEGSITKYLKYAFGEIVLVVVGILIALSINNWNLFRQDRELERTNLVALQNEFAQNRELLQEVQQVNVQNIANTEKMIQAFSLASKDTITGQTIAIYAGGSFGSEINFAPETGVLAEILSSGELKLLQNDLLKHKLAGFYSKIDQVEQQEEEVYEYRMLGIKQMILEGNLEKAYADLGFRESAIPTAFSNMNNRALLNSLPFLNQLVLYQSSSKVTGSRFYDPLDQEMNAILELIAGRLKEL